MAENIGEGGVELKAIADLALRVENTRRLAAEIDDGTVKQGNILAALNARIAEIQSSVSQAIQAGNEHAAVIESLRTRADAALKQIEEDTRKANSESGFAFNAKINAEEHAKAIAQIRGVVDSTFAGLNSTKAQTDALAQAMSLSGILCSRHSMTQRSIYANEDYEDAEIHSGCSGAAARAQGAD